MIVTRLAGTVLAAALVSVACSQTPIARRGPAQQRVVARIYPDSTAHLRAAILDAFDGSRSQLQEPFRHMSSNALTPPTFSADWLVTTVDPGGYLDAYRMLPADMRSHDVLIQDPTGDFYWNSEYGTTDTDRPVRFHCGFILHLVTQGPSSTEVQVYELVPSVWPGEHWAFSAHGVGVGRYHDIRFVEPTVTDRVQVLELLDRVLRR